MAREDLDYVLWVKARPCLVAGYDCSGPVEAHHAGRRGLSQKAHDHTCIPLCMQHHREWHDASGHFRRLDRFGRRKWAQVSIEFTQDSWRREHPGRSLEGDGDG